MADTTLEAKKLRIMGRLESTIESVNTLLYEINQELENTIADARALEKTADTYQIWLAKN
ncbi:hypothetical protein PAPHI01_1627 [Pancytospora philotis]|nr:hypothetical protein PAPHI01_1627 [Pancytospora philotis]